MFRYNAATAQPRHTLLNQVAAAVTAHQTHQEPPDRRKVWAFELKNTDFLQRSAAGRGQSDVQAEGNSLAAYAKRALSDNLGNAVMSSPRCIAMQEVWEPLLKAPAIWFNVPKTFTCSRTNLKHAQTRLT